MGLLWRVLKAAISGFIANDALSRGASREFLTKLPSFPIVWEQGNLLVRYAIHRIAEERWEEMEEVFELATAIMVVVFAAALLVSGRLFIENRSSKGLDTSAIPAVTLRVDKTR